MLFDTKLIYTFLSVSSVQLQALYAYLYHQLSKAISSSSEWLHVKRDCSHQYG